jgi:hypothetical protein
MLYNTVVNINKCFWIFLVPPTSYGLQTPATPMDENKTHPFNMAETKAEGMQAQETKVGIAFEKLQRISVYMLTVTWFLIILIFFYGIILLTRYQTAERVRLQIDSSVVDYLWSREVPYFENNTNVCYANQHAIRSNYTPFHQPGYNLDLGCENAYPLGFSDYVYTCIMNDDVKVVLSKRNGTAILSFSWEQFCTLMFVSGRLAEDVDYLLSRIKPPPSIL